MANHLERYRTRSEPVEFHIGKRVIDCLVGLPPPHIPVEPIAVQLNTGLASGPTMFKPYGEGLNAMGYATIITSPHNPTVDNPKDVMLVSEAFMDGYFGYTPEQLSFAVHSFGMHDTIKGLSVYADDALLNITKDVIGISPVGYGGAQHVGGAAKTVIHDMLTLPSKRDLTGLAAEAFMYTARAGMHVPSLIREARSCDLGEQTREVVARGIGVGAVLFTHDNMVHHGPALRGLQAAGVERIESIPGDHTAVLSRWQETLAAGLRVRDGLDQDRAARGCSKSA